MKGTFYGWYMKCQSTTETLAVIPAIHQSDKECTCSIQILTDHDAWNVVLPSDMFRKQGENIWIGENYFGQYGMMLNIQMPELTIQGNLDYGTLSPLRYDIMGPFAWIPFLECRHNVWSMKHTVNGTICINNQLFNFQNACGYWEGDEGSSFPKEYAWTQCFFQDGSLMLSVADIPMVGFHFTGVIGVILWHDKEYRLATYLGAKVIQLQNGMIQIKQGNMRLEVRLLEKVSCSLKAPVAGDMKRTIQEGASCRASYRFFKNGNVIFDFETNKASFEYEYPLANR